MALPIFLKLLRRFENFVGYPTQHNDTMHQILLTDTSSKGPGALEPFHLLPIFIFTEFCYHVEQRVKRDVSTLDDLTGVVGEMNLLLTWFCAYCTEPVFNRFSAEIRTLLSDRGRSSLEAFREQFARLIDDYCEFSKGLNASLNGPVIQTPFLPRPKPL